MFYDELENYLNANNYVIYDYDLDVDSAGNVLLSMQTEDGRDHEFLNPTKLDLIKVLREYE
jgi:hypothetical protein